MIYPGDYPITLVEGATFSQEFQLKDSNSVPVDLSLSTVSAYIKAGDQSVLDLGVVWVDRVNGSFSITATLAQTLLVEIPSQWFLFVTNPDSTKDCWVSGLVHSKKT